MLQMHGLAHAGDLGVEPAGHPCDICEVQAHLPKMEPPAEVSLPEVPLLATVGLILTKDIVAPGLNPECRLSRPRAPPIQIAFLF